MAINQVNTSSEEQRFKFLANQSSILHTIKSNNINVNGVNVIVDKPKRGDIMCITRYEEGGVLLGADQQKVVWIDGLSIEPKFLSEEYEPVGICISVKGNKAMVKYREEKALVFTDKDYTENLPMGDLSYKTHFWLNNGFAGRQPGFLPGCCKALYYDYFSINGDVPSSTMSDIHNQGNPVSLDAFTNSEYCQILRDNFDSYDEYLNSLMVKYPCNKGGVIASDISGKENTYILAKIKFASTRGTVPAYPAASYVASMNLNAPKLGSGNWWIPSAAEMVEIMRDITYGTSFWDTNPDIINRVLTKLNSVDSKWSMLDASESRYTSSARSKDTMHYYSGFYKGGIFDYFNSISSTSSTTFWATPITIYEF